MVPKGPSRTFSSLQELRFCKQGSGDVLRVSASAAHLGHCNPDRHRWGCQLGLFGSYYDWYKNVFLALNNKVLWGLFGHPNHLSKHKHRIQHLHGRGTECDVYLDLSLDCPYSIIILFNFQKGLAIFITVNC